MTKTETVYQKKKKIKQRQLADLRIFLRGKGSGGKVREYIGLNVGELKILLESRMKPSMSWNNYGKHWQVDHVVPFWLFDMDDEKDLKLVWHPDNLLPLIGKHNNHKEGNLEFALSVLRESPWSHRTEILMERVEKELKIMDEYKKTYLSGKYYNSLK